MKRLYILLIVLLAFGSESFGQGKVVLGQYFQNLPAFSPAFTGANDFLDSCVIMVVDFLTLTPLYTWLRISSSELTVAL